MKVDGASCELPLRRQTVADTVMPLLFARILASIVLLRRTRGNSALLPGGDFWSHSGAGLDRSVSDRTVPDLLSSYTR